MGVDLFFSNHLEHLAEKLAVNINADKHATADPLIPLKIIVPNTNLAKWLTLMLARRNTIVMNVDLQFLEIGLWQMLAALNSQGQPAEWLNKTKARLLLLFVLTHIKKDDPNLTPIAGYLFSPDGQKKPDYTIRLWQLAERLAHLFQEYEYHRTDMIRRWGSGFTEGDDLARCEQRIYLSMIAARDALYDRSGEAVLSLMEYAERILSAVDLPKNGRHELERIHLFGLSQVSAFHLALVDRLTPYYDFLIYALNPSREFWEDIRTPAEKRWIKHKNTRLSLREEEETTGELFDIEDHPLLAAWGKPGRESVRLLCRLTDYSFHAGYSPVDRFDTVLACVQHDILTLGQDSEQNRLNQDRSLQIYGCPGIQREVETIYNNILFNLSQNEHLQLPDIAVLVPNITEYKPVFDLVFNRSPKRLTYSLVDSRADIESVYGQAILGLLSLATNRFSRKTVFDLILNPCFMHKWRIETDEARIWVTWAESLNIFHSFEKKDPSMAHAPLSGHYTFKQGLQRLRLARIFSKDEGAEPHVTHFNDLVPFADPNTSDTDLLEKFCLVVEALDRAATTLRMGRASATQWRNALLAVSRELLSLPPDYQGEKAVRQGLVHALDELTFFDRLHTAEEAPALDAILITEYLRHCLSAISGGSGDYLTRGVTISELTPMRPIPFKIIYVLGMEEGGFPGRGDTSALDLRLKKRRIGDINLPERNRYLFLETLLAAREKLYISYISRDLQKDRIIPPGNDVNRLRHFIEDKILPQGKSFQIRTIPLKGGSPEYLKPDAVSSWSDVCVNDNLIDRVVAYRTAGLWPQVQSRFKKPDVQRISLLNPDLSIPGESRRLENQKAHVDTEIQLGRLARFLEKPMIESIRHNLGLFEEETGLEERIQIEDEPFTTEYPLDWRLKMLPMYQWLDLVFNRSESYEEQRPADYIFERVYADYSRVSATPDGWFATIDKSSFRRELSAMEAMIAPLIDRIVSADEILTAAIIGAPADTISPLTSDRIMRFDPLYLPSPVRTGEDKPVTAQVVLHGHLRWMWFEKKTGWHVLVPTAIKRLNKTPSRHLLNPILFYLASLTAKATRTWIGKKPLIIHMVNAQTSIEFTFHAYEEEANDYLYNLIAASLEAPHDLWMPFELMTRCKVNPLNIDPAAIDNTHRTLFKDEVIEAFTKDADELELLVKPDFPEDLLDRAVKRFHIFGKLQASV